MNESRDRIKKYVSKLLTHHVKTDDPGISDNLILFVEFLKTIYKNEKIFVFDIPFVENIEKFILLQENLDIIKNIFRKIKKYNGDCDLILSGEFGIEIFKLIEKGMINFENGVVVVNGSLRKISADANNKVEILMKNFDSIEDRTFVLLDDSYVYGGTRDRINDYLKNYDSEIIRTYAFYTHHKEDPDIVYSEFCAEEEIKERIIPVHKNIEFINKYDLKSCKKSILEEINNSSVDCLMGLVSFIRKNCRIKESFNSSKYL